jgi:osomolarity two-component system response regulator SKN7
VAAPSISTAGEIFGCNSAKLRVRRTVFMPDWAVPPRVLFVDDDVVIQKLGSKFLQVFGCTIDVVVDGVSAVSKMMLEKYDLVLMVCRSLLSCLIRRLKTRCINLQDIVMPKLDGISATSLIRQFDHLTPVISMTSNSRPSEIMSYYSSGV